MLNFWTLISGSLLTTFDCIQKMHYPTLRNLLGTTNFAQSIWCCRNTATNLYNKFVRKHPLTWNISFSSSFFSPGAHLSSNSKLSARKRARTFQTEICLIGVSAILLNISMLVHLWLYPAQTIKLDELLDHLIVDCGKISHVILGIYQLLFIKRSL